MSHSLERFGRPLRTLHVGALLAALAVLAGCPGSSPPPADPAAPEEAPPAVDEQTPEADAGDGDDAAEQPSAQEIVLVAADRPYRARAGRSPIPEPDEQIEKPLAYTRLAEPESGVAPPEGQAVTWQEAPRHLGHMTVVEGKVVDTFLLRSGNICFLNFKDNDREAFYIAMFDSAFEDLPQKPDVFYLDKTIRVRGRVTLHKNRPQIQVHRADQIEVLE